MSSNTISKGQLNLWGMYNHCIKPPFQGIITNSKIALQLILNNHIHCAGSKNIITGSFQNCDKYVNLSDL